MTKFFFFTRRSDKGKFINCSGEKFEIEQYPESQVKLDSPLFKSKKKFKTLQEFLDYCDLKHC